MVDIFDRLSIKKKKLDALKPLAGEERASLQEWLDTEYTYTSNWIEGNTLTREQTALVLEKGITIEGKTLREHVEATNHQKAIGFIRAIVKKGHQYISENDIKDIHRIILTGIEDRWAGIYRQSQVFIRGAATEPPPPNEVPWRMRKLVEWLGSIQGEHPVKVAADFHLRFVDIHPFIDGNGRTARLLMNLILLGHGYPIAIVKTEERQAYMQAIGDSIMTGSLQNFYNVIAGAVERSLDAWTAAAHGKPVIPYFVDQEGVKQPLLFIGAVAKESMVSIPTVRYYVSQGLIRPTQKSQGGFMQFDPSIAIRIKQIKKWQREERLTIEEIKARLVQGS
ncbi:MAG: Fic family protein [Candidatus Gottesmanbacteria bacterium]|nr:Fic family protein [Candidatus Gottesmanbacteria bacterium]